MAKQPQSFWDMPVSLWLEWLADLDDRPRIKRVADSLNIPTATLRRYLRYVRTISQRLRAAGWQAPADLFPPYLDDEWHALCYLIGRDPARPVPPPAQARDGETRVICAIADTHGAPFMAGVVKMLDQEQPDIVVVAGDVFDAFSFSRWPKDHEEPIQSEMARVRVMLEILSGRVGQTYVLKGNHDQRIKKLFMQRVDERFLFLVDCDLIAGLAADLENVECVHQTFDYTTSTGVTFPAQLSQEFFVMLGDWLFCHPELSRKNPLAAPIEFAKRFVAWAPRLGLPYPAGIAAGHQHIWAVGQGEVVPIAAQLGYMGMPASLQYSMDSARLSVNAPEYGYLRLVQVRGEGGAWETSPASVRYQLV